MYLSINKGSNNKVAYDEYLTFLGCTYTCMRRSSACTVARHLQAFQVGLHPVWGRRSQAAHLFSLCFRFSTTDNSPPASCCSCQRAYTGFKRIVVGESLHACGCRLEHSRLFSPFASPPAYLCVDHILARALLSDCL